MINVIKNYDGTGLDLRGFNIDYNNGDDFDEIDSIIRCSPFNEINIHVNYMISDYDFDHMVRRLYHLTDKMKFNIISNVEPTYIMTVDLIYDMDRKAIKSKHKRKLVDNNIVDNSILHLLKMLDKYTAVRICKNLGIDYKNIIK